MAAKGIARMVIDRFSCPVATHNPTVFLIQAMPVKKLVDYFPVIRLGDIGIETGGTDIVAEGSSTYLICGLPVARQGDKLLHGGEILTGSPTEFDGGPTFSLPKNIKIGGAWPYKNKVVRDLYYLSQLPNGQKILDGIAASGQEVIIVPGNGNMSNPDDPNAVKAGKGSSTLVNYDPDDSSIYVEGENGQFVPCPPQLNLGHELIHAQRWGSGGGTTANSTEEYYVIGPPYSPDWAKKMKKPPMRDPASPTENGLHKDMGLKPRTGYGHKIDQANPAENKRPGECPGTP
ncbi:MAG TPA: hypothetical protein DCE18_06255 [Syntrophobacteraceae bacterium]|nr:hypothetical protein [Syntrophobacteraceae bacterium]